MPFSKYEDTLSISKFQGINQCTDGHNMSLGYAVAGRNFDTSYGGFRPFHKAKNIPATAQAVIDTTMPLSDTGDGALTLAFFTKRWQLNAGVIGRADSYENAYCVAVVDGKLYYRRKTQNSFEGTAWTEIKNPSNNQSFAFKNSKFDFTTYELNYTPPVQITAAIITAIYGGQTYYTFDRTDYAYYEVHSDDGETAYYTNRAGDNVTLGGTAKVRVSSDEAPMDCLLITNAEDGMWCIYAPLDVNTLSIAYVPIQPYGETVEVKFGAIARYAERIWGTSIDTDPDKLMYSAPYDVFNWEQFDDQPDDGAGDIQQPNWDGDKFVAIKQFGSSLLAIKGHAIWRITGMTPSEFVMKKQYGEGTIAEDTFVVNGAYAYMLTDDDIKTYDGNTTRHLRYGYVKDYLQYTDLSGMSPALIGRMVQDSYILQIPHRVMGNLFVIYNSAEGMFNVCESEGATALETFGEELYGLYPETYTRPNGHEEDDTLPANGEYLQFGKFLTDSGEQFDAYWESCWSDLGLKHVVKSGFVIYLMFDRINSPDNATISPTVTVHTEKKSKSKTVTMSYNKVKRIHVSVAGRQFKLAISIPKQSYEWKISTGIQIYVEYDAD